MFSFTFFYVGTELGCSDFKLFKQKIISHKGGLFDSRCRQVGNQNWLSYHIWGYTYIRGSTSYYRYTVSFMFNALLKSVIGNIVDIS